MTIRFRGDWNCAFLLACLLLFVSGCVRPRIMQKPIVFDAERAQLSLEYLEKRHDIIQTAPSITPRMVVVHYTVIPTMEKTHQAFYNAKLPNWRPELGNASALNVSSQYVIDRDGKIYQLLPDTIFARHTIGLNHCAIGIENVADGKDLPLTQAQLKANVKLIRELIKKYDIEYVIGHHEYQQFIGHPLWRETDPEYLTRKSDPGDEFMREIRTRLQPYHLKPLPDPEVALANKEMAVLNKRLVNDALIAQSFKIRTERYLAPEFNLAEGYLQQLQPDGRWTDIDYADTDNEWDPLVALNRILIMTYAYREEQDPLYQDQDLLNGIGRALKYWYQVNPTCRNWYKNDIGKQFYLNVIALLLQGDIDDDLLARMVNDLTAEPSMTGSNKTLLSISVLYRGVIEKNMERIARGVAGVLDQIAITDKEGIQPDYSFHQHGPFLYNGSYGHNFLRESIWLASLVQGTRFAFTEDQMKVLRDYYLEGTRWMIRGGLFDYNVRGRQVGRSSGFDLGAADIIPQLDRFILADPKHQDLYQDSRERIRRKIPQNLSGNRHFWRSDYTVHHRDAYFTSLKMCSQRTTGMEMDVNTENLYGYYLPYGLTYIYRRGDEYLDIFPVWDWARLPGVTSPHQELRSKGKSSQQTTFVGGASNGIYGVSAMDLDIQDTQAKKSWFWFEQEWVALGAGIRSNHEAPIVTGVNQSRLNGAVTIDGQPLQQEQQSSSAPLWVWHDTIAYVFPDRQNVVVKAGEQSGNLQKIFGLGADTIYRSEVFSLWLEHGAQPMDATYAYVVVPGCHITDIAAYASDLPVSILSNTPALQAVAHRSLGITGIAFHAAGELKLADGTIIGVDHPCLVLMNTRKKELTISDPTARLEELSITLALDTGGHLTRKVTIPSGAFAGQSITLQY